MGAVLLALSASVEGWTDSYGHVGYDSVQKSTEGPAFVWNSIASTGTTLSLGEDDAEEITLPFTFEYFGNSQSSVWAHANGFVSFSDPGEGHYGPRKGAPFPDELYPETIIAGAWDDLDPTQGGSVTWAVEGTSPHRELVIEYDQVPYQFDSAKSATFQIRLLEGFDAVEIQNKQVDFVANYSPNEVLRNDAAYMIGGYQGRPSIASTMDGHTWAINDFSAFNKEALQLRPSGTEPAGQDDTFPLEEDTTLSENVFDNDQAVGSTQQRSLLESDVSDGTLTLNNDGSFIYTPDADFVGTDSFEYKIADAWEPTGYPTIYVVTLNVREVNDPPVLVDGGAIAVDEDDPPFSSAWTSAVLPGPPQESSQTVTVDTTNDNPSLFVDGPALALDGTLEFELEPDACGTAQVTVTAKDDGGTARNGADKTVVGFTIDVACIDDPPVAVDDVLDVLEDNSGTLDLTVNDVDPDEGDTLQVVSLESTSLGALNVGPGPGEVTFVPKGDAYGSDSVSYLVEDGSGLDATGTLELIVRPVNDAPTASNGGDVEVPENTGPVERTAWSVPITPGPAGTEDDQEVTITVSATDGTLFAKAPELGWDGTMRFEAADDECGGEDVEILVKDDGGVAEEGEDEVILEFRIVVLCVNDPPVVPVGPDQEVYWNAGPVDLPSWGGTVRPGPDQESDQNVDLLVSVDRPELFASGGLPVVDLTGALTYQPESGMEGVAKVTLTAVDDGDTKHGGSDTTVEVFEIDIQRPNLPPEPEDDLFSTYRNVEVMLDVLVNDIDPDGDPVSLVATGLGTPQDALTGSVSGEAVVGDGQIRFTPEPDHQGDVEILYTVQDDRGQMATGVARVQVEDPEEPELVVAAPEPVCPGDEGQVHARAHYRHAEPAQWELRPGNGGSTSVAAAGFVQEFPFVIAEAGAYKGEVEMTFEDGATVTTSFQVEVMACIPPEADFASNARHLDVTFRDRSTDDQQILSWMWDFGDGGTAEGPDVVHTYTEPGTYLVRLTVTDNDGRTAMAEQALGLSTGKLGAAYAWAGAVPVEPEDLTAVEADADMEEDTDEVGEEAKEGQDTEARTETLEPIQGTAVAKPDGEGFLLRVQEIHPEAMDVAWDLGDGQRASSAEVHHVYAPGTYRAVATWMLPDGRTGSASVVVTAEDAREEDPDPGEVPRPGLEQDLTVHEVDRLAALPSWVGTSVLGVLGLLVLLVSVFLVFLVRRRA